MQPIKFVFRVSIISLFMSCGKEKGLDSPLDPNGNNWHPPVVTGIIATKDTIAVNDSVTITATSTDNGSVVKYAWAENGTSFTDTTTGGTLKTAFADSGRNVISVKAMDNDNVWSATESCVVFVKTLHPPVVHILAATSVNTKDSLTITATATDNGTIKEFVWTNSEFPVSDTTATGSLKTAFIAYGPQDQRVIVRVKAMDDDGLWSLPDSCRITVTLDAPILTGMHDTVVSDKMSVTVHVTARDTNKTGSVQKYYWDIGADGWDDSTDAPQYTFSNPAGGPLRIIWEARDDDGVFSNEDAFTIQFNRPPNQPTLSAPGGTIAWNQYNFSTGKGTVPLLLAAVDPDGPQDSTTFILSLGASAASLINVYTGKIALFNAPNIDSNATVFWRLTAKDLYGDTSSASGSFTAPHAYPPGMAPIASGTFSMGETGVEDPVHSVTLSSFWMDTVEVTQADYLALMGTNPSQFSSNINFPVEKVSWFDAARYCNARSKHAGLDTVYDVSTWNTDTSKNGYRLPTDAQWEYAYRGGTTSEFYWGTDTAVDYAWYARDAEGSTHVGAEKKKNEFGLYDMAGNVAEWCNDYYGNYDSASVVNPMGPSSGTDKVFRGGSWTDASLKLRAAVRASYQPAVTSPNIGFRVTLPRR